MNKKYIGLYLEELSRLFDELSDTSTRDLLKPVKERLSKNLNVDPIHNLMTLLMSSYLIKEGWKVSVEEQIRKNLIPDILASKDYKNYIVEVENPNVSFSETFKRKMSPEEYQMARTITKIVIYSPYVDRFGISFYNTPRPNFEVLKPVIDFFHNKKRDDFSLKQLLEVGNLLYNLPDRLTESMFLDAKLDDIYLLNLYEKKVLKIL